MKATIFFTATLFISGFAMAQDASIKNNTAAAAQSKVKPVETEASAVSSTSATVSAAPAARAIQKTAKKTKEEKQQAVAEVKAQKENVSSEARENVQIVKETAPQERSAAIRAHVDADIKANPEAPVPAVKTVKNASVQSNTHTGVGIKSNIRPVHTSGHVKTRINSGIGIGLH